MTAFARLQISDTGEAPVDYAAAIGSDGVLVRYVSVVDRDQSYDVLTLPHGGEPHWGPAAMLWSPETRDRLVATARALARDHAPGI